MEFSLDFLYYYMICALFSHTHHVTYHVTSSYDFLSCECMTIVT